MPNIFGIDFAKALNDAVASAGGLSDGTLTKTTPGTRTPGSLTGGTNPTTTQHSFKGSMSTEEDRREGQVGASTFTRVSIIANSVSPAAVPEVNDSVTIEGSTFILTKLSKRDDAAAVYVFDTEAE